MGKRGLGIDVLTAARQRIARALDACPRAYLSLSGGKDSSVMLHLVAEEARRRRRKIGCLFIDLEAQYNLTIAHVSEMFALYADCIEPLWCALPLNLRNAVSIFGPQWMCWDPARVADWVREPPLGAITDPATWPWFRSGMEFEEFTPAFAEWYAQGQACACFVGIRTAESLNRWRTIASTKKGRLSEWSWTTRVVEAAFNVYPIYDWSTEDVWTYVGKFGVAHNKLYDHMHAAGLTIHQQRICQPYGDDQRKGLWLYHVIEPDTWGRVVARVSGANGGALYAQQTGNMLGRIKITRPAGHTWESYARLLLDTMPPRAAEHYKAKIAVFLRWYEQRGYPNGIPDDGRATDKAKPSWARICKALLRHDYWCKGLSFSQHRSAAYERYLSAMKAKRAKWNLI